MDDRFPSHRKVALLSDRAFRLYVSALCWASENLTEGVIRDEELRLVAHIRGMKSAAKELEDRQLWDRVADGWQIHDFLEYNPDRAKVQAERKANAARQQAWRDRKKAQRAAKEAAAQPKEKADRNGVTHGVTHGVSNGTPVPPPSPTPASPTEKPASKGAASPALGPQIPDFARDLVDQMTAAGLIVGWRLSEPEWFAVHAHIKRSSVEAMVAFARRRWNPADPPQTARYLTRIWSDMPSLPDGVAALPSAVGADVLPLTASRQQQETNDLFDRAMQRAKTRMQEDQ
ncbi:hypothetical protein ACIG0D_27490 [Streptomyces sp. NPDC052773]|uniref:hypothetical protein n=1 Tax=Streptomyces sp. NPDC052773 TaxID=3365693 RepID=UPI0037CFFF79